MSSRREALEAREAASSAALDRWIESLGGPTGERYGALYSEARELAGDQSWAYLEMAQAIDESWVPGQALAEAGRETARRTEEAAAACLQHVSEVQLAAARLAKSVSLAEGLDPDAGPGLSSPEITLRLRVAMGLADRPPTLYQASMLAVSDLARTIGVRS